MTLRELAREVKDYPATTAFCFLWIMVFVAMIGTKIGGGDLSVTVALALGGNR